MFQKCSPHLQAFRLTSFASSSSINKWVLGAKLLFLNEALQKNVFFFRMLHSCLSRLWLKAHFRRSWTKNFWSSSTLSHRTWGTDFWYIHSHGEVQPFVSPNLIPTVMNIMYGNSSELHVVVPINYNFCHRPKHDTRQTQ